MMSEKNRVPVMVGASPKMCPVCGKRAYSAAGTHPQCAQRQADAARKDKMAEEKAAEEKAARQKGSEKAPRQQRSWKKKCPKCDAEVHVRKKVCTCGHNFFGK